VLRSTAGREFRFLAALKAPPLRCFLKSLDLIDFTRFARRFLVSLFARSLEVRDGKGVRENRFTGSSGIQRVLGEMDREVTTHDTSVYVVC